MERKISDVCSLVCSGGTPNKKHPEFYENGNIPWLNTAEIKFNRIYSTENHITELGLNSSSAKWVPENTVIVAMYGATAARAAIAKIPLTTNQACCNLVINDAIADYQYVYYWLCSQYTRLASLANGGAQQNLNAGIIKDFPIWLPDLETQKKIVKILSALDDKIEENDKISENLSQQAQALYKFQIETYKNEALPAGWRIGKLGDIVNIWNKTFNPAKSEEVMLEHYSIPAYDEAKFPVYEMSTNIKSNKFVIDQDCVLVSKLNPTTKRVWRPYCISEQSVCSTEFIVYKAKTKDHTAFLFSIIDSPDFMDFMCSHVTGSTGSRQRTTPSDTLQYEIVIPSVDFIQSFSNLVSPMYTQISTYGIENASLRKMRDALVTKIMNNEIDVSSIRV